MSKLDYSPEKWPKYGGEAAKWWEQLSLEQRQKEKEHFMKVREWTNKQRNPYPSMWDIADIRVNKLSQKQIYRIWVFHDKHLEL